jgi:hypothetical protein
LGSLLSPILRLTLLFALSAPPWLAVPLPFTFELLRVGLTPPGVAAPAGGAGAGAGNGALAGAADTAGGGGDAVRAGAAAGETGFEATGAGEAYDTLLAGD